MNLGRHLLEYEWFVAVVAVVVVVGSDVIRQSIQGVNGRMIVQQLIKVGQPVILLFVIQQHGGGNPYL